MKAEHYICMTHVTLAGLHLESCARGCKIIVWDIQGGRSPAYVPMAMYLPKSLGGGEVHLEGPMSLLAPSICRPGLVVSKQLHTERHNNQA